jgi:lipoprotein-anchoring transpeptidase ErfK/SrfK
MRFCQYGQESIAMTKFRYLIWMMVAAGGLVLLSPQSQAQTRQPDVGDQPGLIADDSVELEPQFRKTAVLYRTNEAPGTIIVVTAERHLYLVQGNGRALRYGIGVGREGFTWQGLVNITRKAEWPDWTPPPEMIARPCTASTAPTGPTPSAPPFHPVASAWSTPTWQISMSACLSAPR